MNEYKGTESEPSHRRLSSPSSTQQHTAWLIVILITFYSQIFQWPPVAPIKRNNVASCESTLNKENTHISYIKNLAITPLSPNI